MKVADLILFVRNIINDTGMPGDVLAVEVDDTITSFIQSAAVQLASMPTFQSEPTELNNEGNISFSTRPDGMYYAEIKPGEDFLRPVSLILDGWVKPVFVFNPATGSDFLRQYSSAPGIGSGPHSPAAFVVPDTQNLIIGHAVKEPGGYSLKYIAIPEIDSDGIISMPLRYKDPLAYTAAGLYLQSIVEYDAAKTAFDTAASFIQSINNKTN